MAQPDPEAWSLHIVTDSGGVPQLGDALDRLLHVFSRARSQLLAKARQDVEWSAIVIIGVLVRGGPMRSGALAEIVQSDPSTISRQVAALVRDGFVERQADPDDGRATVLVATDKARAVVADHTSRRDAHYERMLAAWSEQDRERLATLVARFAGDFEQYRSHLDESGWLTHPDDAGATEEATS